MRMRIFLILSYLILIAVIIFCFCIGINNILLKIALGVWCLEVLFYITKYIIKREKYRKVHESCIVMYNSLIVFHKERYKLSFSENVEEEINYQTELIDTTCEIILCAGEHLLKDEVAFHSEKKEIKKILENTELLQKTIQTPYNLYNEASI